jgi:hypothetical protein
LNPQKISKEKESKMKTTKIFKLNLIVLAVTITMGLSNGYSQSKFTSGSYMSIPSSFDFRGTVEGVIEELATINFTIFKEGSARILVLDPQGNLINELVEGDMTPGVYSVHYKTGTNMPAGEYFLKFEMNGESKTERFIKAQTR